MKALDIFNFGTSIKRWISTFYTNIESAAINNGFMTNWFRPSRGVRQGCPLSPYLFVLSTEVLSNKIRHRMKWNEMKNQTRTKYNRNQNIRERNQIEPFCGRHEPFLYGFALCRKCFENGWGFWEASGSQVKHKEIQSNLVRKMGKKKTKVILYN